jgi:hypothetical protein
VWAGSGHRDGRYGRNKSVWGGGVGTLTSSNSWDEGYLDDV